MKSQTLDYKKKGKLWVLFSSSQTWTLLGGRVELVDFLFFFCENLSLGNRHHFFSSKRKEVASKRNSLWLLDMINLRKEFEVVNFVLRHRTVKSVDLAIERERTCYVSNAHRSYVTATCTDVDRVRIRTTGDRTEIATLDYDRTQCRWWTYRRVVWS